MLITRKLEMKMNRVKIISRVEFNLLMLVLPLSEKIADYWYRAYVSVINGTLEYIVLSLVFVKSSYKLPMVDALAKLPPVPDYGISSFFFFWLNPLIFC